MTSQPILLEIIAFLIENIKPIVNDLDSNTVLLNTIFCEFKNKNYFKIYVPNEYGGEQFSIEEKLEFEEAMGRWGGAFSFLQAQCATSAWMVSKSSNISLKEKFLSSIATEKLTIGNSLSQMKPNTVGFLTGEKRKSGYLLNGRINFISGWRIFDYILIGFQVENKDEVFALIKFEEIDSLKIKETLDVISMNSINTVSIEFNNYIIKNDAIVLIWKQEQFYNLYKKLIPYSYPLGIAKEALHLINIENISDSMKKYHNALLHGLIQCKAELLIKNENKSSEELFSMIVDVTWKCMQYALITCGGSGLLKTHRLQGLYRELPIWIIPRGNSYKFYSELI